MEELENQYKEGLITFTEFVSNMIIAYYETSVLPEEDFHFYDWMRSLSEITALQMEAEAKQIEKEAF